MPKNNSFVKVTIIQKSVKLKIPKFIFQNSMDQNITITLDKQEKEHLSRLALRYGLSLSEFSRKVLTELNDIFPKESFSDYKNPKKLKKSMDKALLDWQTGRVQTSL